MVNQIGMNTRKDMCKMGIVVKNERVRGMGREFIIVFMLMNIFGCVIVCVMYYNLRNKYNLFEIGWSLCELFFSVVASNMMEIVEMRFVIGILKGKCKDIRKVKEIGYCKEIIFDKTWTLTEKKFQCEGIEGFIDVSDDVRMMVECVRNRITTIEDKGVMCYVGDEIELSIEKYHGFVIKKRKDGKRRFEVVNKRYDEIVTFVFDPFRCIESVVVKDLKTGKYYICGKGKCEREVFVSSKIDDMMCRKIDEGK